MASSSNPVGTYTDAALVAIQKMLGIYEAPWELIKDSSVTFATEADMAINTDEYGEPFELTDVRGIFWFPTQENEAKIDNGTVCFNDGSTRVAEIAIDKKTVTANSVKCGAYIMLEQKDGMMYLQGTSWHNSSVLATVRMTMRMEDDSYNYPFRLTAERSITEIALKKITGTLNYRIYGKRKWRT